MEEEQKEDVFQPQGNFESRINRTKSGSNAKRYLIIVLLIIVLGLLIFGLTRFIGGSNKAEPTPTPAPTVELLPTDTPTPTPEESPTPTKKVTGTPTPKPSVSPIDKSTGLDRSKLSIHVFNGSGVTGAAKKATDFLEGLGYNVVDYDNAENSDYAQTEIQISSAQSKYLDLLKKDLSTNYTVGSSSTDISASESANAVVIIGKQ